jgi:hypothetical protein
MLFYEVNLPPQILERGFWLYVWKIVGPHNETFCYVGMTGDVTGVAQSPFARAGSHFSENRNANAIKRHLEKRELKPERCSSIRQLVFGPLYPYWHSKPRHADFDATRDKVAALERKLWTAARDVGNEMLNRRPNGSDVFDAQRWAAIRLAFLPHLELAP